MEYIQHPIQLFQNAIQYENEGKNELALQTYKQGINELTTNMKFIKDEDILNQCHSALKMYRERVCLIEKDLQKQRQPIQRYNQQKQQNSQYQMKQIKQETINDMSFDEQDFDDQQTFYKLAYDKDFNGQVDDILKQVYADIQQEEQQNNQIQIKQPPPLPPKQYKQKPIMNHQNEQKQQNEINQKEMSESMIDRQLDEMDRLITEEMNQQKQQQDNYYPQYIPVNFNQSNSLMQQANYSIGLTESEINDVNKKINKGKKAEKKIQKEEQKFNCLLNQNQQFDDVLNDPDIY